jgi:hypothetical protein
MVTLETSNAMRRVAALSCSQTGLERPLPPLDIFTISIWGFLPHFAHNPAADPDRFLGQRLPEQGMCCCWKLVCLDLYRDWGLESSLGYHMESFN